MERDAWPALRSYGEDVSDDGDLHNSDDSMTSESGDLEARERGNGSIEEAGNGEDASSSPPSSSYSSDMDADEDQDVSDSEEEEEIVQDMSFAERVARENRRSRRHKLLCLARDQSRHQSNREPSKTTEKMQETLKKTTEEERSFRRDNKHRPVEMSSKKRVSVLRDATLGMGDGSGLLKKRRVRDPRFDSIAGAYSEKAFKKRYSFIFDEKLPEERRELKESLTKIKSDQKREKLQRKLQKITQQIKTEENRRKQEARREKVLRQHKEATQGQKNKFHLKKSDLKKQELILKYQELKETGGLERYMEKRRKRNAAKDHRYMPEKRESR